MKHWMLRKHFYRSDASGVALVAYFWCLFRGKKEICKAREEKVKMESLEY